MARREPHGLPENARTERHALEAAPLTSGGRRRELTDWPSTMTLQGCRFIDPDWLVETEIDAAM